MFFIHRIIESYFNDNCHYLDFTSMHTARHLCVRFLHAPNALWIKFAILVLFIFITVIFICCICWVILKKESSVNQSISISLKLDFNINASANLCLTGKPLHVYICFQINLVYGKLARCYICSVTSQVHVVYLFVSATDFCSFYSRHNQLFMHFQC